MTNTDSFTVTPNPLPGVQSIATAKPTDPRDTMSQDDLLLKHKELQEQLAQLKSDEMDLRKYIVNRAFPVKQEGTNTVALGNGYELKAAIKYNYKLIDPAGIDVVQAVDACRDKLTTISSNEGTFIAERLFKYSVDLSLSEYRLLIEDATSSPIKKQLLSEVNKVLEITEAAPTLTIREPKGKKS